MNAEEERYLASAERGFLATVNQRGLPTVVPVCFVYDGGKIYSAIDRKPKTTRTGLARTLNLERNDNVAFVVDRYSEDWNKLSYLLVHGKASLVVDDGEREKALGLLSMKYPQYRRLTFEESTAVIAIQVGESKYWAYER